MCRVNLVVMAGHPPRTVCVLDGRATLASMSGLKVEQKQSLSRAETAKLVADLAEGLKGDGEVTLKLGGGTVELTVGSQIRCELEVEADGEKFELELELKWSSSNGGSAESAAQEEPDDEAEGDGSEESKAASKRTAPQNRRSPQERRPAQS
jgi:amphi-Trp domain-containing protein